MLHRCLAFGFTTHRRAIHRHPPPVIPLQNTAPSQLRTQCMRTQCLSNSNTSPTSRKKLYQPTTPQQHSQTQPSAHTYKQKHNQTILPMRTSGAPAPTTEARKMQTATSQARSSHANAQRPSAEQPQHIGRLHTSRAASGSVSIASHSPRSRWHRLNTPNHHITPWLPPVPPTTTHPSEQSVTPPNLASSKPSLPTNPAINSLRSYAGSHK